jgi:hypothetical protein
VQRYEWEFREGGSARGTTDRTSDSANGSNGTTYRYVVRACNARGCGPWESSNRATPTAPPPKVTLTKGAKTGVIPPGSNGSCESGNCWFYNVSVSNFNNGTVSGHAYCNGSRLATEIRIEVRGGSGSYTGRYPDSWCGYSDAYVIIGGVRSNNW